MNDTSPRAAALVLRLLDRKSPSECVEMMGGMFEASRAFMTSALTRDGIIVGTLEWRLALLERTYGGDISSRHRQQLIERWSRR